MKKIFFLLFSVMFTFYLPAQTRIGEVLIPNTVSFEGIKLELNGVGVREKYWLDMYVGALYLNSKSSNANAIISANEPMAIKLYMVSKLITSDRMIESVNEGFAKNTESNSVALQADIEKFKNFFKYEISKDDVFDLVYLPERGVVVYKNGKELGTIKSMPFKKTLFGIWLSNNPADKKLKSSMLGK